MLACQTVVVRRFALLARGLKVHRDQAGEWSGVADMASDPSAQDLCHAPMQEAAAQPAQLLFDDLSQALVAKVKRWYSRGGHSAHQTKRD